MKKEEVCNFVKRLFFRITRDDFFGTASEMSYMFALGIFPFMTFVVAVFGWLGKRSQIDSIVTFFKNIVPNDVVNLIMGVVKEVLIFENGGIMAVVGLLVTIFLAANAIAVIIKGLNKAYNVEEKRSFIHTRLLAVLMVLANALVAFLSVNLIIFGKVILNYIFLYTNIEPYWIKFFSIIRWPLAFFALYFMSALNYYVLPSVTGPEALKRRSVRVGSLFFCVFWLLGSATFSTYINNLNTYNKVYGTLGAFAILLVWLFYTSLIILIGGELNSQNYKKLLVEKEDN